MNSFQIEQLLQNVKVFGDIDKNLKGGANFEASENTMQKYYPIYTRPILSENEYVGAMTTMAKFIADQKSIARFVDDTEVMRLLNPAELVLHLVKSGKIDCIIIRNHGQEKVSFSVLKRNPIFEQTMIDYYKKKNESMKAEFYDPISKIEKE